MLYHIGAIICLGCALGEFFLGNYWWIINGVVCAAICEVLYLAMEVKS